MISVPLARSYRPSSLLVFYCVFHFCHVLLSHRFLSLSPVSKLFLASRPSSFPPPPREILFPHLHLPIYALVYSRSLVPFAPAVSHLSIQSLCLSSAVRSYIYSAVLLSLFLRFSPRATDKPFSVSRCTVHLSGIP